MTKFVAALLALALLPVAAGCGNDDSSKPASSNDETSAQPAAGTSTLSLDADEQKQLDNAQKAFADYCKTKRNEPVGSIAIAESLLTYGRDTRTAHGELGDVLAKSRDQLQACGAKPIAKRLDKALAAG